MFDWFAKYQEVRNFCFLFKKKDFFCCQLCKKYVKINEILYVNNENLSMSIETIASMSHMLAIGLASDLIELHTS